MKGVQGQISLFDIEPRLEPEPENILCLPCDTCGYDVQGCCDYPVTTDDYCILGDKWIPNVEPGDWVEEGCLGERLSFDDITRLVGQMIIIDKSTQSRAGYKVVLVEKIVTHDLTGKRSLIYYDGVKQRGMINELYFGEGIQWQAKAWRVGKE